MLGHASREILASIARRAAQPGATVKTATSTAGTSKPSMNNAIAGRHSRVKTRLPSSKRGLFSQRL
jgi:hypothetical protein